MLSYQHTYHAGNHADVLKHILLGDIIAGMQRKAAPIFMLDAFASRGLFDLASPEALKNREFDTGIGLLWPKRNDPKTKGVARWFRLIAQHNPDGGFTRYPGSTAVLASMLREEDRLAACDLHPQEFDGLRGSLVSGRNMAFHKRDAFEAIKGLLPPKEKRGLLFLDPSYENKQEYRAVARAAAETGRRFPACVQAIWYPLLPAGRHNDLFAELKRSGLRKILRIELDCGELFPQMQMHGSGLLVVNPPWHGEDAMKSSLAWIRKHLTNDRGMGRYEWLVPE